MVPPLTESQSAALFDILTHYDTYAEIRDFRQPGSLDHYGPPFATESGRPSTSPALQSLVSRFALELPGLRDLPEDFWKVQIATIIEDLEKAELSESYDKGVIGSRKTLSTAISALMEYPVRGTFGGFARIENSNPSYNLTDAADLVRAFRDFLDQCVYGEVLERLVEKAGETDNLEEHEDLIKAVHEFVLVNLASFMHYTLILSPKGQYLVKLIDNINKLVPYVVVRQTLKIGNVASMLNAMMKVILAKMSVASLTNWIGLTSVEDEGMNLMQSIISTVLSWDNRDLESRASKIEKDKQGLTKEQVQALKGYQSKSREEHEAIRQHSRTESVSIVTSILSAASLDTDLSEAKHSQALDYLGIQLSIRDRKEIIRVLCHSSPDHLTSTVRALVSAYEPVIRRLHNAIDLSDTVYDFEIFLKDMLKLSKVPPPGKDGKSIVPTVGDFVRLLKKHQYSSHKFIHQCCKNDREFSGWYLDWAKKAATRFKCTTVNDEAANEQQQHRGAGKLTTSLNELFASLSEKEQAAALPCLDAQSIYLDHMHAASLSRLSSVLSTPPSKNPQILKILTTSIPSAPSSRPASRAGSPAPSPGGPKSPRTPKDPTDPKLDSQTTSLLSSAQAPNSLPTKEASARPPHISSDPGPGAYLSRWADLLDNTPITPLTPRGRMKTATSKEVIEGSAIDVDGEKTAEGIEGAEKVKNLSLVADDDGSTQHSTEQKGSSSTTDQPKRPDVRIVIDSLAQPFRKLLGETSIYW